VTHIAQTDGADLYGATGTDTVCLNENNCIDKYDFFLILN